MKLEFSKYKQSLFEILLSENYRERFLELINILSDEGSSKKDIYSLFLALHQEIQDDSRTENKEYIYNNLSDFMDGFTSFSGDYKILPNEPDV